MITLYLIILSSIIMIIYIIYLLKDKCDVPVSWSHPIAAELAEHYKLEQRLIIARRRLKIFR